jgi:DNA-binding CsgD family transcriptional regulator
MDALRAQMAIHGYNVPGLSARERERVWYSLAGKRRRGQLAQALWLDEDGIDALVAAVRQERGRLIGRR